MEIKKLVLAIALLPVFSVAYAATTTNISELFPYAAQSHDKEGELEMKSDTKVEGSNNYQLDFISDKDDDDIKGKCDGIQCTLTNNLGASYALSWSSNWQWNDVWQPEYTDFPVFKTRSSSGRSVECGDGDNNNKNASFTDNHYEKIKVKSSCTINASSDVTIKGKLEVVGSGTLYLAPGDYWVNNIELDGSGKIKATKPGAINLYIKNSIDLGSQPLGTNESPVNIYHYDDNDFELKTKLIGALRTRAKLKMSGSSKLDHLLEAKAVELQGSAKLTLLPKAYWFEKFGVSGSSEIVQPQAGDVNLHVKENVSIKISALGKADRRVNINNYNKNVDLGESLTWYGDLNTHVDLKLHGSSKLYGAVRAKSLDLQDSAKLHLTAGEYWYEDIELQGSSEIKLVGDRLTHLHILDELELKGESHLNKSGQPLLVFVYGEDDGKDDDKDDGDVDLKGSSTIYGHLYVQGEVELQGSAKIYGAVNVVDLEMKGSSAIIYRELEGVASGLSHYQLDYIGNSEGGSVALLACADDNCSQYQDEVTDVVVRDAVANENIISFESFTGSSKSQSISINNCVEFTLAKSEPWPSSSRSLRCYINGQKIANCKLCDEPIPLYGYVFGQAEIPQVSANDEELFKIVSYSGPAGLADVNDQNKQLKKGTKLTLPLFVTLEQAGVIELVLQDEDKRDYPVTLRFAPKSLAWEQKSGTDGCGDNGFEYASHNKTCVMLGAAGQDVTLILQAYGEEDEHGQPQLIANYQDRLASEQIKVEVIELNAEHTAIDSNSQAVQKFDFVSKQGQGHKVQYLPKKISLVKATVYRHYSSYGKNEHGSGVKFTKGDSQIIGRIVPEHLYIKKVTDGTVINDVAYRAKPVEFSLLPKYEVVGCAANDSENCKLLPSYTGQFAEGLKQADSLEFVVANDASGDFRLINNDTGKVTLDHNSNVEPEIEIGTHTIEPNPALELIVAKQAAKPAENIEQDLRLKISISTDATLQNGPLSGSGDAKLAKDAELRYGFLKIYDTELSVNNDSGLMDTSLLYYGASTDSIEEDNSADYKLTDYNLTVAGGNLILDPEADSPSLSMENDNVNSIKVMPNKGEQASGAWRGDVLIKNTPPEFKWLKPYNDATGELTDPKGQLIISDRKRGSDRVFNRREVIR